MPTREGIYKCISKVFNFLNGRSHIININYNIKQVGPSNKGLYIYIKFFKEKIFFS